ncbi:MAG: hypothetical protein HY361_01955 [Candidatus Aenigmarchaeota archaeon]|nr:hypothetical protein [Candidatus Aenigmarchaeota archaeon]
MKGISSIIATLLMLIITIALVGFSYTYISGVFTTKTSEVFYVVDSLNDTITISNDGTAPITAFRSVKIDGNDAVYSVSKQDNSLVGYWKMDEGSGTIAYDSSGNGNYGPFFIPPSPSWVSGKLGFALRSASTSGLRIGNRAILNFGTGDFTLSAWVKTANTDSIYYHQRVITMRAGLPDQTAGYYLTSYNGRSTFQIGDGTNFARVTSVATNLNNDIWHHLVAIKRSGTLYLYIDGNFDNSASASTVGNINNSVDEFQIANYWSTGEGLDGDIDEVKVYNRALSESEIKANYDIGAQINPGEIATIKIYNHLSKGSHTLKICTTSTCNTAVLRIN